MLDYTHANEAQLSEESNYLMPASASKHVASNRADKCRDAAFDAKKLDSYVSISSSVEGISFERAKKNTKVISLLKKYGHAFSI